MAPKNSPEKQPLSKEEQKQQEIDKVLKGSRGELNSLQQFIDQIKATVTNFTNILGNAFKSFFGSGGPERQAAKAAPKIETPPQPDYRGPYKYEYLYPQGIANSSDYLQVLYSGHFQGKKFFVGAYSTGDKYGTKVKGIHETAKQKGLNKFIKGFKGTPLNTQMIETAAKKHNVDPYAVAAIIALDSSMATKGKAVRTNNPGNVGNTDDGSTRKYASLQDGVDAVANNLEKRQKAFQRKFELYPGANA